MNIWNEKGAFCHNYTHLQQVGGGRRGGGVTGIKLSVHPSVGRMVPKLLVLAFLPRVTIYIMHMVYLLHLGSKGKRSSTLDIKVAILCLGSRELSILPRFTISYMGQIYIWFSGSRALSFLPRVTISYIYTHETKMLFIEF